MRIIFMGTPDFACSALAGLISAGHELAAVYTRRPRPGGRRGLETQKTPVHLLAESQAIPVQMPENFKARSTIETFTALNADIAVVVAYGIILPSDILKAPRLGCINSHASLLPRWRGAAPVERAIMAGDDETGISLMQMDEGLDTGPVLAMEKITLAPRETAQSLQGRLADLGTELLLRALPRLQEGAFSATSQPERGVTYAKKISKEETRIDWSQPAARIDYLIRALSPFPGAWFDLPQNQQAKNSPTRIKVLEAEPVSGEGKSGKILDAEQFIIACGDGALKLNKIQRAGKPSLASAEFLRGAKLPINLLLE